MNLIIIQNSEKRASDQNGDILRFAVSEEPLARVVFDGLSRALPFCRRGGTITAVPEEWGLKTRQGDPFTVSYGQQIPVGSELMGEARRDPWLIISNGRFVTRIDSRLLRDLLASAHSAVVAVGAEPGLLACREKIRFTSEGKIAGFRRLYTDAAEPAPAPSDWPHHLFIRTDVLGQLLSDGGLPRSFGALSDKLRAGALTVRAFHVAGDLADLGGAEGLLEFCSSAMSSHCNGHAYEQITYQAEKNDTDEAGEVSRKPRLIGKVLLGQDIHIGPDAVIIGPTIICNGARIERKAVISSAVIGPRVQISARQVVQNCVLAAGQSAPDDLKCGAGSVTRLGQPRLQPARQDRIKSDFRTWPRLSYAGSLKRIADCLAAAIVLILFAPVLPVVALAVKLTSSGPVFFKDRRQGLHGRPFNCLKFRTMRVGSDKIQDKLRVASQVDGPQFKMEDDPRITAVGRFLRETYVDEIPQFFNVLVGQMSVVGPRPSPEPENRLCPSWRDARLSVRPGVTGLWQIWRTREPMKDFQEWIHYDTRYVRELSLRLDLWICWRTFRKMAGQFIGQFG
ncbi:MAG: sugar transferase [Phycisphaerales bacterium]|nr:MAG: sugar transferase [Phycisphaerales bacterium]